MQLQNHRVSKAERKSSGLTSEAYFGQLEAMISQVREDMAKMEKVAKSRGKSLSDPNTHCAIFCNAIIKLRFAYAEEFRSENLTPALLKTLYSDANNIFLTGLFRTRRGSCVSMPLIYLVIGQKLGLPVHLVTVGRHYFIRWEEPGYRMNIETTIVDKVSVTPDDSVYLEVEGMTREQLKGSDLRNLTHREVVGNLSLRVPLFGRTNRRTFKLRRSNVWISRERAILRPTIPRSKASTRHSSIFTASNQKTKHPT